ncbi:MAG: DUF423 domain-containing protein [Phycisphaerae bacterium]|jgi:uncharacterized membrane protein YgdD (TMEM256/DUF423 family)
MLARWSAVGALFAFLAVAAGAFGAHGLRDRLSVPQLVIYEVAVRYQMYHALALVVLGLIASRSATASATVAGWSFVIGIVLFSGSLYALSLSDIRAFGAIAPFGGVAFLAGWGALAIGAWKNGRGTVKSREVPESRAN